MKQISIVSFLFIILFSFAATGYQAREASSLEKQVLEEMNLARTNPDKYADLIEATEKYYRGKIIMEPGQVPMMTREGKSAVKEAVRFLRNQEPRSELNFSNAMSKAAIDHVKYQGKTGQVGHTGQGGSTPFDRLRSYGTFNGQAGENISYGYSNARKVVMQLIIDDGVADRGHRTNIFKKSFHVAGVGCGTHKTYRHMCVIIYATSFNSK